MLWLEKLKFVICPVMYEQTALPPCEMTDSMPRDALLESYQRLQAYYNEYVKYKANQALKTKDANLALHPSDFHDLLHFTLLDVAFLRCFIL